MDKREKTVKERSVELARHQITRGMDEVHAQGLMPTKMAIKVEALLIESLATNIET